jgi:hypothetical protein
MRTWMIAAAFLAGCTFVAGCTGSPYFRPHAFVPPLRHYRVRYDDPAAQRVLAPGWQVLNFRDGRVAPGGHWTTTRSVDEGRGPRPRTIPLFDLFAEHERDGAALFVMTVPLELTMGRRDLRIVAHEFIDELAGSAVAVVRRVRGGSTEESLVASRLVEDTVAEVGGAEAYLVTLERRIVGSSSVVAQRTMTFVLIRPHRRWRASGVAEDDGAPMLVMVGLESPSERYDAHRGDLDSLLGRLDVRPAE